MKNYDHVNNLFPLVSIIILCFNDLKYMKILLPQILENTVYPNYELIIIDNGSSDNLKKWIKKNKNNYPKLRYFFLPKNIGFGKGMNIGMKKAKGKYLIICNSDILLPKLWLSYLVKVAESDPQIAIVGCPQVPKVKHDKGLQYAERIYFHDAYAVACACFLYRKEYSEEDSVGKFDRYFHSYKEDLDLIYRVHLHGYRVIKESSSYIVHDRYLDTNLTGKKKIKTEFSTISRYQIYTNSLLYFSAKWDNIFLFFITLVKLILSIVKAILIQRDVSKSIGILKGIFNIFHDFSFIYSIRTNLRQQFPRFKKIMKHILKLKKQYYTKFYLFEQYKRISKQ